MSKHLSTPQWRGASSEGINQICEDLVLVFGYLGLLGLSRNNYPIPHCSDRSIAIARAELAETHSRLVSSAVVLVSFSAKMSVRSMSSSAPSVRRSSRRSGASRVLTASSKRRGEYMPEQTLRVPARSRKEPRHRPVP